MVEDNMFTQREDGTIVPMTEEEAKEMFDGFRTIFNRPSIDEENAMINNNNQSNNTGNIIWTSGMYGEAKQPPTPEKEVYVNKKYVHTNSFGYSGGYATRTGSYGTYWDVQTSYTHHGWKPMGNKMYTSDHDEQVYQIYREMHIKAEERFVKQWGFYNGYIAPDLRREAEEKIQRLEMDATNRAIEFNKSISRLCSNYLGLEVDEEELSMIYDDREIAYPEEIVKKWELFRNTELENARIFSSGIAYNKTMTVEEFDRMNLDKIHDKYISPEDDLNTYFSKIGRVIIESQLYLQRKANRRNACNRCLPLSEYIQPLARSLANAEGMTPRLRLLDQIYKSNTFRKHLDSTIVDGKSIYKPFTHDQVRELNREVDMHNQEMISNGYAPDWQKVPINHFDEYNEGKRKFLEACKARVPEPT